ncbi:hypothetical protein KVE82_04160 [Helicobacter pylori]|uniref:hypothetical protein n=1 Tax=Helicobacter pylori TaxID=210 RepID=UPI001ABA36B7|nr:hypothetical protein [Helicobacter pylori]WRE12785.1 hypothetical protein KVE82_04160 [Helicobacter pylori]
MNLILNPLKKAFQVLLNTQEWQNKVKVLLDSNKSALAEMNDINEQLLQVQKKL